jgi:hypothetical protein
VNHLAILPPLMLSVVEQLAIRGPEEDRLGGLSPPKHVL